jgi:chromosome segregation ATPase
MAIIGLATHRDGWNDQAPGVAYNHKAAGTAPVVVASPLRERPALAGSKNRPRSNPEFEEISQAAERTEDSGPTHLELTELNRKTRRGTALQILKERVRKLVAEAAAKDKLLAEQEDALRLIREECDNRENENSSLQLSLSLVTSENARLSSNLGERSAEAETLRAQLAQSRNLVASLEPQWDRLAVTVSGVREQHRRESGRLSESIAQLDAMRSELEQTRAALVATENERDQIKSAAQDASELHRTDYSSLNSRLEAMTSRALAMEGLVADVGRCLLLKIEESKASEHEAVNATLARNAAVEALNLLQAKTHQVQELEQTRTTLIASASTLLNVFEMRVTALAATKKNLDSLEKRLAATEAKATAAQKKMRALNSELQSERAKREAAEAILEKSRTDYIRLRCALDRLVKREELPTRRAKAHSAELLLASTIAF